MALVYRLVYLRPVYLLYTYMIVQVNGVLLLLVPTFFVTISDGLDWAQVGIKRDGHKHSASDSIDMSL